MIWLNTLAIFFGFLGAGCLLLSWVLFLIP